MAAAHLSITDLVESTGNNSMRIAGELVSITYWFEVLFGDTRENS